MNIKLFHIVLISLMYTLVSFTALAQPKAFMSLEKDSILIGDQVQVKLSVQLPVNIQSVQFPSIPDTFGLIEVLSKTKVDSIANKDYTLYEQQILITCFDKGTYTLPNWNITYKDTSGAERSVAIPPSSLHVQTIEVDTNQTFKPIFEIEEEPAPDLITQVETFISDNKNLLIGIGIGLLVIVLALLAYIFLKKKKKEVKEVELPFIKAQRMVMELEQSKIWEQGKYKDYYSQLSEIVKNYFEEQLSINANEMTTRDLLLLMKKSNNFRGIHGDLRQILQIADITKFAKGVPTDADHEMSVKNALRIIEHTKPQPIVTTDND